jgi:hypothetical protein
MTADPVTTAPEVPGYLLADLLGRGGVGTVWAAMRLRDSAPVAVKVVAVGSEEQADLVARELAVLARVDVEGLVGFHEAIGLAGSPPSVALVLDRVDGGSLEGVVAARGHLSVGESVTILAPVARALAGLHGLGVVHGDVTPANVLLERTGQPLLADLGVASLVGEVPGQLYGTTGFVAPEVVDRGVVTTASDVYAVGALAWWCVTGQAPGPVALRRPLDELAVGLPAGWSEITRQALLGDPDARPSAAELALAYYDSAVCEPLRLVVGGDETSLLTQRLRQPAQVALPGTAPPTGSRRRRGLQACRAVLARAATRSLVGARLRAVDPRRLAAFGTAVLLVAGLVVGGLMVTDTIATPDWVTPDRGRAAQHDGGADRSAAPASVRTSAGGRARPATPTRVANAVATDRTAPQRDPRGLMADLSHLRASVMMSGSATQLALLDAPGSPALAQDTAVLRDLAESGQTWQGVTLTVGSARSVSHTGTTATVDAVVETAAYRVVDVSGRTQLRPALAGQHLRFALVWSGGRWRIESITGPEV